MEFPAEFVKHVKEVLPGNTDLHAVIERGSDQVVGHILEELRSERFSAQDVLDLIDENKVQELRAKAAKIVRIGILYREYLHLPR